MIRMIKCFALSFDESASQSHVSQFVLVNLSSHWTSLRRSLLRCISYVFSASEFSQVQDRKSEVGRSEKKFLLTDRILGLLHKTNWESELGKRWDEANVTSDIVESVLEKLSSATLAYAFFEWCSKQGHIHNAATFIAMLRVFGKEKDFTAMWDLVHEMKRCRCLTSNYPFAVIILSYGKAKMPDEALKTLSRIQSFGRVPSLHVFNCLLTVLLNAKDYKNAELIYKDMLDSGCSPDIVTFNILIDGFGKEGNLNFAWSLLQEMKRRKVRPNVRTYTSLIASLGKAGKVGDALRWFKEMKEAGLKPDVVTYTALISALGKSGKHNEAFKAFEEMEESGCPPDAYVFNILIHICGKTGQLKRAGELFNKMQENGNSCAPTIITYNSLIHAFCLGNSPDEAYELFRNMKMEGFYPDEYTYAILIDSFCKAGNVCLACKIFHEMGENSEPFMVTYGTLISSLLRRNQVAKAREVYDKMKGSTTILNLESYKELTQGLRGPGDAQEAVFEEILRKDCSPNVVVYNRLIDGLAKSGNHAKALTYFQEMKDKGCQPDVISYTIIIHALGQMGNPDEALTYFNEMKEAGVVPDLILYNTLINILNKGGRVDAAQVILDEVMARSSAVANQNSPSFPDFNPQHWDNEAQPQ